MIPEILSLPQSGTRLTWDLWATGASPRLVTHLLSAGSVASTSWPWDPKQVVFPLWAKVFSPRAERLVKWILKSFPLKHSMFWESHFWSLKTSTVLDPVCLDLLGSSAFDLKQVCKDLFNKRMDSKELGLVFSVAIHLRPYSQKQPWTAHKGMGMAVFIYKNRWLSHWQ